MCEANDQKLKGVKYINMKTMAMDNENGDEPNTELLIPTVCENSKFMDVKFLQKLICILITIIILLSTIFIYFYLGKNNQNADLRGIFSCQAPDNVERIMFTVIESPNNTCSDDTNCYSLLDKIEKDHMGLKYNFVIGNKGELYVGSGFKCRVNDSENVLHIKVLRNSYLLKDGEDYSKSCLRILEIIEQGLLCGKISINFSAFTRLSDNETEYQNMKQNVCSKINEKVITSRNLHFHDPEHDLRNLIHGDVKWTFCGNFSSNMREGQKNKVVTLESFPRKSCLPFEPVSEVKLYIVMSSHSPCLVNATECLRYFENHDSLNYNFAFDEKENMYVGLGYKCKAQNGSDNVLKIKQLVKDEEFSSWPIIHILNEGLICGKVHENFTLKIDCNKEVNVCEEIEYTMRDAIRVMGNIYKDMPPKVKFHDNQTENSGKFLHNNFLYKACHKKDVHKQDSQT